ncbi:MAG: hypothetical protein WBE69_02905, partial [Candidatus Binataceae bacterium]
TTPISPTRTATLLKSEMARDLTRADPPRPPFVEGRRSAPFYLLGLSLNRTQRQAEEHEKTRHNRAEKS